MLNNKSILTRFWKGTLPRVHALLVMLLCTKRVILFIHNVGPTRNDNKKTKQNVINKKYSTMFTYNIHGRNIQSLKL